MLFIFFDWPDRSADLLARRVDAMHIESFFSAKDDDGHCVLILQNGAG
jgi:hypothetical protein